MNTVAVSCFEVMVSNLQKEGRCVIGFVLKNKTDS
jgi:hypothetical protein